MTCINKNQTFNNIFSIPRELDSVSEKPDIFSEKIDFQLWDYHKPLLQRRSRAETMPSYTSLSLVRGSFKAPFEYDEISLKKVPISGTINSIDLENDDGDKKDMSRPNRNRSQSVNHVIPRVNSKSPSLLAQRKASSRNHFIDTWNIPSSTLHEDEQNDISPLSTDGSEFIDNIMNKSECESGKKTNVEGNSNKNMVSKTLWVGNINSSISVEEITQVFSNYGPIESIRLLLDKECGFINFHHQKDAVLAKEDILTRLGGRIGPCVLKIGYGKADNFPNDVSIATQPTRALWLGNMPPNITDVNLQEIFSSYGTIESVRVLSQKFCGFINYETAESASQARDALVRNEVQKLIGVRVGFAKVPTQKEKSAGNHSKMDAHTELRNIMKQLKIKNSAICSVKSTSYFETIMHVPELSSNRILDGQKLKDIRKQLDTMVKGSIEADEIANECLDELTGICIDYIGNTVIQRLFEKCSEEMKTKMLEVIVPHLAAISIHKNGTWAAQKIIELANTKEQMKLVCKHLQPFIPPLLLDPFGNYVVQGCLRLSCDTQFIINAVVNRINLIVQGRFGARAVRGILESSLITVPQQMLIAAALIQNAVFLSTHTNGTLVLSWLIDSPLLESKRWIVSSRLAPSIIEVATHKFGSYILLKLIYHYEKDAGSYLLEALEDEKVLLPILSDSLYGLPFALKVISSQQIPVEDRTRLQDVAHPLLTQLQGIGYKKASLEFVNDE